MSVRPLSLFRFQRYNVPWTNCSVFPHFTDAASNEHFIIKFQRHLCDVYGTNTLLIKLKLDIVLGHLHPRQFFFEILEKNQLTKIEVLLLL